MNRKTTFSIIAAIIIISVGIGIIRKISTAGTNNEIKIGILNPSSGELANYADQARKGIDLALEELNQKSEGGNKIKYKAIYEDTKGESKSAISALNKLMSIDQVDYFVGDISSTVTLSLIPIIDKNKKLLFSPGAASPKLYNSSSFFARNWPSNDLEATSAAEYSIKTMKSIHCVIVYVNNDWGIGLKNGFERKFQELGGTISSSLIYEYEQNDFKNLIAKLKSVNSDILYLAGNQKEMGNFIKQLRESRIDTPVISNTSFMQDDCLKIAGKASEGVIVPTPEYNPKDTANISAHSFYLNYKKKYPENEPTLVDANGYDAIKLIVTGINMNGNNTEKVAKYIRNLKGYEGAGGKMDFVNGDVIVHTTFKVIKNGVATNIEESK